MGTKEIKKYVSKKKIKYNLYAMTVAFVLIGLAMLTTRNSYAATKFFSASNFPEYVSVVYTWGSGIVVALALVVLAFAGINYMRSMGNQEVITSSKNMIFGAITGLVLVVGGYFLLNWMDPRLVDLKLTVYDTNLNKNSEQVVDCHSYSREAYKCNDNSDCPSQCKYKAVYCKFNADDKDVYDTINLKCENNYCVTDTGFCGINTYGDNSSNQGSPDKAYCDSCDQPDWANTIKYDQICPKGKTCSGVGNYLNSYNNDWASNEGYAGICGARSSSLFNERVSGSTQQEAKSRICK